MPRASIGFARVRRTIARLVLALPLLALGLHPAPAQTTTARAAGSAPALAGIPVAEYAQRRAALLAALPDGIVVLRGSTDEEFGEVVRYFQNNNFEYLTGVDTPGAFLLLDPFAEAGSRETLFLPARNMATERWTGPQTGPGPEAAAAFGIARVVDAATLDKEVAAVMASPAVLARMREGKRLKVYTVLPVGPEAAFSRDRAFAERLADLTAGRMEDFVDIVSVAYTLGEMRRTKSDAELALLRRAIAITNEAETDVARMIAPGKFEYEVEAAISAAFLRNGAVRAGFPAIVASGMNGTVMHYTQNTGRIEAGDLVVVDIGAEYGYYTADVTRTWPASGKFTERQRAIYSLVLEAQTAAARAYKPGMGMRDLYNVAVETMRASPLRDKSGKTLDTAFITGLSHYLGMDVHDVGARFAPLKPGDVFTIEPGIYLQDEKIGVRIEDDYLVTATGLEKLSGALPSAPDEIERMLANRK